MAILVQEVYRSALMYEDKALFCQNFKLYFLKLLDSWSLEHNDGKHSSFRDFVDNIMHGA